MDGCSAPRLCRQCGQRTYPSAWCNCHPGFQVDEYLHGEIVFLQPDESERELLDLSP